MVRNRALPIAYLGHFKPPKLMLNINSRFLSVKPRATISAITELADAIGGKTSATNLEYSPQFNQASRYTTTISANNDLADIYYPKASDLQSGNYSFPIVLLLQGSLVDKSFFSPNHKECMV